MYETLREVDGVELLDEPEEAFWGGGFSWRDPEGNVWDVAWAKGTTIDDRGGVLFPVTDREPSRVGAYEGTWLYFPAAWLATTSCSRSPASGSKARTAS